MSTFRSHRILIAGLAAILVVLLAAGLYLARQGFAPRETRQAPTVVATLPQGSGRVSRTSTIEIAFDQQMDHASVEAAFVITPGVRGSFDWTREAHGERLIFRPAQPLAWDTAYEVTLASTAANSAGKPLDTPVTLRFQTGSQVAVVEVAPTPGARDVDPAGAITVRFDRPLVQVISLEEQSDLPQPVTIEPPVAGFGRWLAPDLFGFYPADGFSAGTTYHVVISSEVAPAMELAERFDWQFTTAGAQVVVANPYPGASEVQVATAITLIFSQPVDRATVERHFRVAPQDQPEKVVAGEFRWEDDRKLVFVPSRALELATQYTIEVTPDQGDAGGPKGVGAPFRALFTTIDFLQVESVQPAPGAIEISTIPTETLIGVQFNHPVVKLVGLDERANLPSPITIQPPVAGQGEWLTTSLYTFRPGEPLLPSTEYRVTVGAGLTDTVGALLREDYTWTFTTTFPEVLRIEPAAGSLEGPSPEGKLQPPTRGNYIAPTAPITVTFNQEMDRPSSEAAFTLVDADGTAVAGTFRWPDGRTLVFQPGQPLTRGADYTATVAAGARGARGGETRKPFEHHLTAAPLPEVISTDPRQGAQNVEPFQSIALSFNVPMQQTGIDGHLTIVPTATQVFTGWNPEGTYLNLWIPGGLQPSAQYRVVLDADTLDATGQPLAEPFTLEFSTGPLPPLVELRNAGRVGTYNPFTPTLQVVAHRNVTRLDFGLFRLSTADFLRLTNSRAWETWERYRGDPEAVVQRWSVDIDTQPNITYLYKTLIPPGEGAAGGSLEPGLYYLEVDTPTTDPSRQIMVVSPINLTLKRGSRDALVWATDLKTGDPIADLPVRVLTENGAVLAEGTTDTAGRFYSQIETTGDPYLPLYAFAYASPPSGGGIEGGAGEATAVVSSNWSDSIGAWQFGISQEFDPARIRAGIYTDRPLYRPGQTVYFKGVIRQDADATYALPSEREIEVHVRNPQGEEIFRESRPLSPFGTFHGQITLPEDAQTGPYEIFFADAPVQRDGNTFQRIYSGYFNVAEYRRPDFQVAVETDSASVIQDQPLNASVRAEYYFGGALSDAPVTWRVLRRPFYFNPDLPGYWSWRDEDEERFFSPLQESFNQQVTEGKGRLDAAGRFTWKLDTDLDKIEQARGSQVFVVEADVTDLNNQTITGRTETVIHQGEFYVGLQVEGFVGQVGEEQGVQVRVLDVAEQPVADQTVSLEFYKREWFSVREKAENGQFIWTTTFSDTLVASDAVKSDQDGKARATFTPQEGGSYTVLATARDRSGHQVRSRAYLWVSSEEFVAWRQENTDTVDLVADQRQYRPGDEARILVPMPFEGMTALVTLERGTIKESRVVRLASNSETLTIPIKPEYAPNVYVSVVAIKGMSPQTPLPEIRVGMVNLPVSTEQQQLNVRVTPQAEGPLQPRQVVTFTVETTDFENRPVSAELSLALVDKALLALADDPNPTLLQVFYGSRPLGIQTGSGLVVNVDRVSQRLAPEAKGGGGGNGLFAPGEIRQEFPETALWEPTLVTDEQGRAEVSVRLPDNLTTWTMTARGVTGADTLVGSAGEDLVSTKPLFVRPTLPRFFVVGDRFEFLNVIHNNTGESLDVTIRVEASGLSLEEAAPRTVTVPAGGRVPVIFRATVEPGDQAEVTVAVEAPGHLDAVRQTLPVYHLTAPETIATSGQVRQGAGAAVESIQLPPNVDPSQGELTIELAPSLAGATRSALEALQHFPYECTEQIVSKFLPNIATLRALQRIGPLAAARPDLEAPLRQAVGTAVQKLVNTQNSDGGWGWWPGENSDAFITGYTVLGLGEAQRAGFAVPAERLARGQRWLTRWLSRTADKNDNPTLDTRAFILYVLSETGQPDSGRTIKLFEQRQLLGADGRAFLALTLATIGGEEGAPRAEAVVSDFTGLAILSATGAHWEEAEPNPAAMDSSERSTALVLRAIVRTEPENLLVPQAVRWLMMARTPQKVGEGNRGGWESTQTSAWAILALTDYMVASGELDADFSYEVALNNEVVVSERATSANIDRPTRLTVEVGRLLLDQANQLVITRTPPASGQSGVGRLYYAAWVRYFLPGDEVPARNEGLSVARQYIAVDPQTLRATGVEVNQAAVGDLVQVKLTVIAPNDLYFFTLEDPLPAGFEALDPSLLTTSQVAQGPEGRRVPPKADLSPFYYNAWSRREIRDEKVALFATLLPRGTYEYTYLMRATVPGEFNVMPALGYEMYMPEVFGRSAGQHFTVSPAQ